MCNVERFKYMGWVFLNDNIDVLAMYLNLQWARTTLKRVSKILTHQEAPAPVVSMFYQAAVRVVFLYGRES